VAGHRLSTGSMEQVLSQHPAVAECAVIGVHDEIKGQKPVGYVVLKHGVTIAETQLAAELVALMREQIGAVNAVLTDIGGDDLPIALVLNKIDRLDPLGRRRIGNRFPEALQVSAVTGDGLEALREHIARLFADRFEDVRLLVPYGEGNALSALYALGAPIDERTDTDDGVLIRARLSHRDARRFARYLVAGDGLESAATT